jgi:hypothetical protein
MWSLFTGEILPSFSCSRDQAARIAGTLWRGIQILIRFQAILCNRLTVLSPSVAVPPFVATRYRFAVVPLVPLLVPDDNGPGL